MPLMWNNYKQHARVQAGLCLLFGGVRSGVAATIVILRCRRFRHSHDWKCADQLTARTCFSQPPGQNLAQFIPPERLSTILLCIRRSLESQPTSSIFLKAMSCLFLFFFSSEFQAQVSMVVTCCRSLSMNDKLVSGGRPALGDVCTLNIVGRPAQRPLVAASEGHMSAGPLQVIIPASLEEGA